MVDPAQTIDEATIAASLRHAAARSAAMNGAALACVALGSAVQVAFYLRYFGATHRTDGLIAALAVYSLIVVMGQLLRTTAIPLLSGPSPKVTGVAFGWAVVLIAVTAALLCAALASPLGHLVAAGSGPRGQDVATSSFRIMAPAIGLQLGAAGLAVRGAMVDRLDSVAVVYMASAAIGLAAFFLLSERASETVLAWTILAASASLVAGLLVALRVVPTKPQRWRPVPRAAAMLVRSIPLPASFVVMYPITLAMATDMRAGEITLFGLAFTTCSYLAGFTGQALSMSEVVTLSRIGSGQVDRRLAVMTRAFRYSLLLAAPGICVAAVAGAPLVRALLPSDSIGANSYFGTFILLLIPWLVATLALWATLPALLSGTGRPSDQGIAFAAVGLLALHVLAGLLGRAIGGVDGLVVAMAVAPAIFAVVGLKIAAPTGARSLVGPLFAVAGAAGLSFGLPALLLYGLTSVTALGGVVAALVGLVGYAVLAGLIYPDAARTLLRLVTGR